MNFSNVRDLEKFLKREERKLGKLGKTRRFPIPPGQPHKDRKSDFRRRPKHRGKESEE